MNYLCYMFLSDLPMVLEEYRFIDGKEQPCLIIPTATNQIKKGNRGDWLMIFRLAECPPNPKQQTHDIQLTYLNPDDLQKSMASGRNKRTMRMGRVYEHDRTPSKKLDRTNRNTDTECVGTIILSDIPKKLLHEKKNTGKRYLTGLRFSRYGDTATVYTGFICVDDIPKNYILTDTETGKKYIRAWFRKLERLDTYMNTHHLVIEGAEGTEIEIGRFKEWVKAETSGTPNPPAPQGPEHTTTINPRPPMSVDGIKF